MAPAAISCFGIIFTVLVIIVFFRYKESPIVRASGREFCFIILAGFICNFVMTFFLLAKPTKNICAFGRFGVGFAFAVMYSPLLVKTNRTSRIFEKAKKSAKTLSCISQKSQLIITLILIGVQVFISIIWFLVSPPGVRFYSLNGQRNDLILKCQMKDSSFLFSLSYNALLIIFCTFYAVKTRKIPKNFNESKFIGFSMYATCITWLGLLPIYFGTLNNYEVKKI